MKDGKKRISGLRGPAGQVYLRNLDSGQGRGDEDDRTQQPHARGAQQPDRGRVVEHLLDQHRGRGLPFARAVAPNGIQMKSAAADTK